jgi:hypothetical protein
MLICFGCSNDDENSDDLASSVAGLYNGTWNAYGSKQSGTCEIFKVSNTSVTLEMEILGVGIPEVPDVNLSDGGDGKIILKYKDSSGNLNGTIQGKSIKVSITDGSTTISFSGTRP